MISSRTRDTIPQLAFLLAIIAAAIVLLTRISHAAAPGDPGQPGSGAVLGLPGGAWLAIGLGAFAGVRAIVDVLLAFFKAEAPLTKTAVDDRIRDDLQKAHNKLDKIAASVNGLLDASKPPGGIRALPGSGTAVLLVVLLLGAAGAGLAMGPGCTAAERSAAATSAGHAVINCTANQLGTTPGLDLAMLVAIANTAASERAKCTPAGGALSWQCVETDAIALGATLGGCAFVQLVAAAEKAIAPAASGLSQGPVAPPGRVELEDLRGKVGGVTWHAATGDY